MNFRYRLSRRAWAPAIERETDAGPLAARGDRAHRGNRRKNRMAEFIREAVEKELKRREAKAKPSAKSSPVLT